MNKKLLTVALLVGAWNAHSQVGIGTLTPDRLSERRAKSTRQWLIDQGIEATRLTAKGYGERELINECADGVNCSEEAHQANRRSEFIVVEL